MELTFCEEVPFVIAGMRAEKLSDFFCGNSLQFSFGLWNDSQPLDMFFGVTYAVNVGSRAHRLSADHFHYSQKGAGGYVCLGVRAGDLGRVAAFHRFSDCD